MVVESQNEQRLQHSPKANMAADIDLAGYNPVAQALLTPFDDSEISERKGSGDQTFSYVPPERYRYRLLQVFTNGFQFHVSDAKPGPTGISGSAHFIGEIPEEGVRYDIVAPCFEPWTISTTTNKPFAPEQSFQKLISAGLKAVCREMGLGLHLYDKAQRTVSGTASKPATTASKPAATGAPASGGDGIPNFDPEWDGSVHCTIGTKIKDQPWANADDSYLEYLTRDPEKANRNALKEIARRQATAGQSGASQASAAVAAKTEEDFEF